MENRKADTLFALDRYLLAKALQASLTTASADDTRPHLAGVFVETIPASGAELGKVRLVSTDGHRLSTIELSALDGEVERSSGHLVRHDDVKRLVQTLKCRKASFVQPVEVSLDAGKLVFRDILQDTSSSVRPVDENFPPYQKVIPALATKKSGAAHKIGINGRYLSDVAKFAALCANEKSSGVRLQVLGDRDPIRVDMENAELSCSATVVIMPMRL